VNRRGRRVLVAVLAVVTTVLLTAGCSLDGRGNLPFSRGTGAGSYTVTVDMADVSNLVPHAEVKVNDVTVGTITSIEMQDWQAVVKVSLEPSVWLPADSVANVGQKSLLGAQYLQLAAPTGTKPDAAPLGNGSVIPIQRTGTYPSTEDLLIALSSFLNGAGLTQLRTILTQMNLALDGRTQDIRGMLSHLQQVVGQLSAQRRTVAQLLDRMDDLTGELSAQDPKIARSLPALGTGLAALDAERPALMAALTSVDQLATVADPVLATNSSQLVTEIRQLQAPLSRIADAGNKAADSLNVIGTIVYPLDRIPQFFRGDYMNLFMNVDARVSSLKTIFDPCQTVYCEKDVQSSVTTSTTGLFAPTTLNGGQS
jgi:phospholipid/cholesterol/gamma-HCH transport system substrate-binding protein